MYRKKRNREKKYIYGNINKKSKKELLTNRSLIKEYICLVHQNRETCEIYECSGIKYIEELIQNELSYIN